MSNLLYSNIDITLTHYSLFNKLIKDKYDLPNITSSSIHPDFKSKYLLVIKNLMSKYDDVKITKENDTYNIVCLSSQDVKPVIAFDHHNDTSSLNYIELNNNDVSTMYDYIYENDLIEYINYPDPFDGNSIFHELVINNNIKQIDKLINDNTFNYTIINNHNQTPIDLINSTITAKILTMGIIKNLNNTKEKLYQEKVNINKLIKNLNYYKYYHQSVEYKIKIINDTDFLDFISIKTKKYHYYVKLCTISFISYLAIEFIYGSFF